MVVENNAAGQEVARHLLATGCEDFFYLGLDYFSSDDRLRGFAHELKLHGFDLDESRVHRMQRRNGRLHPDLLKIIHRGHRTGVFCYHDLVALRLLRCAKIGNYRIPQDLSIVGFDNLPVGAEVFPSLSSVGYPLLQIAENALRILLERLPGQGQKRAHEVCTLKAEVIVRETSR